jgi:hypothetical protein
MNESEREINSDNLKAAKGETERYKTTTKI